MRNSGILGEKCHKGPGTGDDERRGEFCLCRVIEELEVTDANSLP